MSAGEVRVVDPVTGGEKGSKLARFDLIPPHVLQALAEHYGKGAQKYADRNWERGYAWGLSFAALMRHAWAWFSGEDTDLETGSSHMIAVAWHALALAEFQRAKKGTDDRPKPGPIEISWTPCVGDAVEFRLHGDWASGRIQEVRRASDGTTVVHVAYDGCVYVQTIDTIRPVSLSTPPKAT